MSRKILYSPGFGAGWSTWNDDALGDFMATYQPIIDYIEGGGTFDHNAGDIYGHPRDADGNMLLGKEHRMFIKPDAHPLLVQLVKDAEAAGLCKTDGEGAPYICVLGARDLEVASVCGRYRISEYDGSESLTEEAQEVWK